MYKHILVALDGTPESEKSLKQAIALSKLTGASLTGISVVEELPAYAARVGHRDTIKDEFENFFCRVQNNAVRMAAMNGITVKTVIRTGHAARIIAQYAQENSVDLIVVGADRRRGLGGTADKIAESIACSVLIACVNSPSIKVKDVMRREVVSVSPSTSVSQVVRLLNDKEIKSILVMDHGKIVGIITGGDLLVRAGMGLRLSLQRELPPRVLSDHVRLLSDVEKTAKDVMSSPVVTLSEEENITRAIELMIRRNIKRVPVLGKQGELAGVVSRQDLLSLVAALSEGSSGLFPTVIGPAARTAGDIVFPDVPTVDPDAPLSVAVGKLLSTTLRRVVVTDKERHVLGIIVDRDLLKSSPRGTRHNLQNILLHLSHTPRETPDLTGEARDVMIKDVVSVVPDTPLAKVIQTMIDNKLKRIIVADEERRLIGIISRNDVLLALV